MHDAAVVYRTAGCACQGEEGFAVEETFDAIVVGGGLSGLAAAYTLAREGKDVLLLERGDYAGAKNVTGGRMYVAPIRDLFPGLFDKAPFERPVVKEELEIMSEEGGLLVSLDAQSLHTEPYQSYTVCRAKFDKWFAKQAQRAGASIVTKAKVDRVIVENGAVVGVQCAGDVLRAHVVICCDGVLSFMAEQAGLRKPQRPEHFAVGLKEVIELPEKTIEERFGLAPGEGAARLYMGDCTKGKFGGGFLYTGKNSVSIGLVLGMHGLLEEPLVPAPKLLEDFLARPEVAPLIKDGERAEYSAHVISEGGYNELNKLVGDGILVAGDAAGFALNGGILVRGMEYAMASGYCAAQAVVKACERGEYSASSLACYEAMLNDSFVMQDFKEYQGAPVGLDHERFFGYYPKLALDVMTDLFTVPSGPKHRIYPTLRSHVGFKDIKDIATKDMKKVKLL